jgi:hypothetical protein
MTKAIKEMKSKEAGSVRALLKYKRAYFLAITMDAVLLYVHIVYAEIPGAVVGMDAGR